MKTIVNTKFQIAVLISTMLLACVTDRSFDIPQSNCNIELVANVTYAQVKALYDGKTFQIQEDLIIEGYVISSDKAGNFFSVIHFQDNPQNPTEGFQIEIDQRDSHLFYPVGSKIYIKLKGLYLGKSKKVYKIGGVFTSFGNISVGRLPTTVVAEHVFLSCAERIKIIPTPITIDNISEMQANTLVQLSSVEFISEDQDLIFAIDREETERILKDCNGNEIVLLNSGYSDFQDELLPPGNGAITGVLKREKDDYLIVIRGLDDFNFNQEKCDEPIEEVSSKSIFISELADPENNTGARFVELYNADAEVISLNGWKLIRYSNKNIEASSEINLSDFEIIGKNTFVVAANEVEFENVYGFSPNLHAGVNSPADSNGDDNLQLIDPFGVVIDVFGIIGEDGSNTNHEFEDGRAVRNFEINQANSTYTFSEWQIFNDTGSEGTMNNPQIAPDDFTPGIHQ